jgi:hypothetical protein
MSIILRTPPYLGVSAPAIGGNIMTNMIRDIPTIHHKDLFVLTIFEPPFKKFVVIGSKTWKKQHERGPFLFNRTGTLKNLSKIPT